MYHDALSLCNHLATFLSLQAAILQQTAEYIYTLEQEKTLLLSQNSQLKRLLSLNQQRLEQHPEGSAVDSTSPQHKKKRPNLLNETPIVGNTILDDNGTLQEDQTSSTTSGTVNNMNLQLMEEQNGFLKSYLNMYYYQH